MSDEHMFQRPTQIISLDVVNCERLRTYDDDGTFLLFAITEIRLLYQRPLPSSSTDGRVTDLLYNVIELSIHSEVSHRDLYPVRQGSVELASKSFQIESLA